MLKQKNTLERHKDIKVEIKKSLLAITQGNFTGALQLDYIEVKLLKEILLDLVQL